MERRKKRIVKLTAFLFLLAASIFVMPQKAFADENEDVTLPTGDIKPMEPQQDESGIDTYGADEGDEFSGTEYELYTVLENRVKEAMLAGSGICGIAVVSAIFAAEDVTKATRELKELALKMKDSTCISKDNASSRKGISC